MNSPLETLLGPYLNPEQAAVLGYDRTLPPETLTALGARLRGEASALRTLLPEPLARAPAQFAWRTGSFWEGSLLCADLSGFTALTERLAAGGRRGVEELSGVINRLFGALLDELDRYGGMVLKFGGDALTAFFDDTQIGADHSAAACAAALAMQRRMAAFESVATSSGTYRLRLRIGVHRGRPFNAVVGDAQRRELVLTGHAVNRVAWLQERAAPGEVLISSETLAALRSAQSEQRQGGQVLLHDMPPVEQPRRRPPLPPLPPGDSLESVCALATTLAELRPFLPAGLPRHALYSSGRASGEFRPVSALFINVTSFSGLLALLDGAEHLMVRALNHYYSHVQRVIGWYGGEVNKFDISSSGDKLLALFGAPLAHEDDPLRAVEAALELGAALDQANQQIRQMLAESLEADQQAHTNPALGARPWRAVDLSLRQRIGVATGDVFAGTVGSSLRREYTVVGQTVNLAARLAAAAEPGAVLVAPATAAAVRATIVVQNLPPLTLKGVAQPVQAALALRRGEQQPSIEQRATPLVGRADEMAALRTLARSARSGSGRVVAIRGEPGVGKSRLAAAYLEEIGAAGWRVIRLTCRSYAQNTPYSMVRDLLGDLLDLPVGGNVAALGAAIGSAVETLAPVFVAFTSLLDTLFHGVPAGEPLASAAAPLDATSTEQRRIQRMLALMPQAEQRERLHEMLVALALAVARQQPLALLIDDLHWCDSSSLEVVRQLARVAEEIPLLLLLAYRSDLALVSPMIELPEIGGIEVEPLDHAGSIALLTHLLGAEPPIELDPILDRAEGSPLFLEALVRHLIDRGALRRDNENIWRLEALEGISIPTTLEPILAAQLDRLDEATRELVQVAAVIGTRISYAVLAGVYSQARQPAQRLMELVQSGILVSDEQDSQAPFRFRQTLLREVAYQSILYSRRRDLHRRVAVRIEAVFADQIEMYAAELSHHYVQAADWPQAFHYALRAARHSRAHHALPEARIAYGEAYSVSEAHDGAATPEEQVQALEELADIEAQVGLYESAHRHYRDLLDRHEAQSDKLAARAAHVALRRKIGGVYEQQGLIDAALHWLNQAYELVEQQPHTAQEREPSSSTMRARALERTRVCSALGWVYFRRSEAEKAQHWLRLALSALEEQMDDGAERLAERARVHNRLGGVAWMRGDLAMAQEYVERSLDDCAAIDDLIGAADAENNLGILFEQSGNWKRAITYYSAALATNQQLGRRHAAAMSRLNMGAAHFQMGEADTALPLLEAASVQMSVVGDALHEAMALRLLGRALTLTGRFDDAAETLYQARDLTRQHQLLLEQLDVHTALGELAVARGDDPGARSVVEAGWALYSKLANDTLEAGLFLRLAAQVAERSGEHTQGEELRAQSEAMLRTIGVEE